MKATTAETLAWVLIYGGLLLAPLGIFLAPRDAAIGAVVIIAGLAATAAGALLIWLRSRMKDDPKEQP
jgi:hypothetical protein